MFFHAWLDIAADKSQEPFRFSAEALEESINCYYMTMQPSDTKPMLIMQINYWQNDSIYYSGIKERKKEKCQWVHNQMWSLKHKEAACTSKDQNYQIRLRDTKNIR